MIDSDLDHLTIFNERHSLQPTSWLVPFDTLAA
jgi:hypothetical protein